MFRGHCTVRNVLLRELEIHCVVIGLDCPGCLGIRGKDAPPSYYLDCTRSPRNSHQHSPAGMHLKAEGCALHGDSRYLRLAWGECFMNSVSLSCGKASMVWPSTPVMVWAATMAFTIASSVASTVA